ncbi:transporter [Klebsiella pneumoniae]|nr:transporter [Klebsiella pneumoniae]
MFLIATVGALTISLVVTAATFTRGLSALTGLPDNFTVQAFVILLSGGIFCMSSWIGINNGLQRLSKMVGWGAFLLPLVVLLVGPTEFITNNVINAVGLTTQNFLQMSLFTDPLGDGAFTRNWTVFYWLWWISYTPGVAMFVTRVSRGRKIKEVIWGLLLGSTAGCWFFFGVMESYAMHQFVNGVINVPQVMQTLGGETAVQQVLMSLPAGKLFLAAYLFVMIVAATFTRGLSALTGLPDNFTVQAFVILLSGGIFCMSSWIGINNGLQRLSKMVGWGAFLLPLVVLLVGPTEFITNNIINAVGLTTQNFLQMSLFTDPLGDGAFTRNWTVFYWLWWISYTPGVAMFVTRVSRGRKIKEVIWGLLLGSTAGCWFFFGVMESYAMHQFVNGVINVPQVMQTLGGETAVQQVLMSLPAGKLFLAAYLFVMIVFLASHMDAVAYTMAATSTRNLREGEDPDRGMRLFWCVVITLIPLSILFTGASLETMKTTVVLTALPFLAILLIKTGGFVRWLKQDYAHVPVHQIETHTPEPIIKAETLPVGAVLKGDGQSL